MLKLVPSSLPPKPLVRPVRLHHILLLLQSNHRSLSARPRAHVPTRSESTTTMAASGNSLVRVAAAQMTSVNDLASNLATCSRLVKEAVSAGAKLLCFPESFSYIGARDGDSLNVAEPLDGPIMQQYCSLARENGIWLSLGGFQEKGHDDAHLCNTHVVVDDTGSIRSTYQKIHL